MTAVRASSGFRILRSLKYGYTAVCVPSSMSAPLRIQLRSGIKSLSLTFHYCSCLAKYRLEHFDCKSSGLGVLPAGMIRADQGGQGRGPQQTPRLLGCQGLGKLVNHFMGEGETAADRKSTRLNS